MYRSIAFLYHLPMIIIVSVYTLSRKISIANPDHSEWLTTSLCENPRRSSPINIFPDLDVLIVI